MSLRRKCNHSSYKFGWIFHFTGDVWLTVVYLGRGRRAHELVRPWSRYRWRPVNRPAYVKFNYSGDPLILAGKMNVKSVDLFFPINSVQTCSAHKHMRVFVYRVGYFCVLNHNCLYGRILGTPPSNICGAHSGVAEHFGRWPCVVREVVGHILKGPVALIVHIVCLTLKMKARR